MDRDGLHWYCGWTVVNGGSHMFTRLRTFVFLLLLNFDTFPWFCLDIPGGRKGLE